MRKTDTALLLTERKFKLGYKQSLQNAALNRRDCL